MAIKLNRTKLKKKKGRSILKARVAGHAVLSNGQKRIIHFFAFIFCIAVLAFVFRLVCIEYFAKNPRFTVKHIQVTCGETITSDLLCDALGIEKGMNIFDSKSLFLDHNFAQKQKKLLEDAPTLASITVSRVLPDKIIITATERIPIARFPNLPLALDKNGIVFVRYKGINQLPSIYGYQTDEIQPGKQLSGAANSALELLDCLENKEATMPNSQLLSIDISKPDYLECAFANQCRVKLAWDDMGSQTPSSHRSLVAQVSGFSQAMRSSRSKGRRFFDATLPGRCYAK